MECTIYQSLIKRELKRRKFSKLNGGGGGGSSETKIQLKKRGLVHQEVVKGEGENDPK